MVTREYGALRLRGSAKVTAPLGRPWCRLLRTSLRAPVLQDLTVCRTRASRRSSRTEFESCCIAIRSRTRESLLKMRMVAREANRLPPNRDNARGNITLVRFFSTSSPWSNIIRSVVGANMIVKDVHRTGNTEQLRYDDTQRCQIGRAASDRAC